VKAVEVGVGLDESRPLFASFDRLAQQGERRVMFAERDMHRCPNWLSLLTTPPYPAYAGNMSAVGAGAATALALAFGTNDIEVSARWRSTANPTISFVHTFPGFWDAAMEQALSRLWGGIHYRFDHEAGQAVGRSVGGFVFANFMRPLRHWNDDDRDDN
jgi:hypothetical protein